MNIQEFKSQLALGAVFTQAQISGLRSTGELKLVNSTAVNFLYGSLYAVGFDRQYDEDFGFAADMWLSLAHIKKEFPNGDVTWEYVFLGFLERTGDQEWRPCPAPVGDKNAEWRNSGPRGFSVVEQHTTVLVELNDVQHELNAAPTASGVFPAIELNAVADFVPDLVASLSPEAQLQASVKHHCELSRNTNVAPNPTAILLESNETDSACRLMHLHVQQYGYEVRDEFVFADFYNGGTLFYTAERRGDHFVVGAEIEVPDSIRFDETLRDTNMAPILADDHGNWWILRLPTGQELLRGGVR